MGHTVNLFCLFQLLSHVPPTINVGIYLYKFEYKVFKMCISEFICLLWKAYGFIIMRVFQYIRTLLKEIETTEIQSWKAGRKLRGRRQPLQFLQSFNAIPEDSGASCPVCRIFQHTVLRALFSVFGILLNLKCSLSSFLIKLDQELRKEKDGK